LRKENKMLDFLILAKTKSGPSIIELNAPSGPSSSVSWAVVLFFVIVGLLVTLTPSRRTIEIKKP
jgi:hypothetical protein